MRPSSDPARMMTVIAANTNWKYISVAMGKVRAGMPDAASGTVAWPSVNAAEVAKPGVPRKLCPAIDSHAGPNAML